MNLLWNQWRLQPRRRKIRSVEAVETAAAGAEIVGLPSGVEFGRLFERHWKRESRIDFEGRSVLFWLGWG